MVPEPEKQIVENKTTLSELKGLPKDESSTSKIPPALKERLDGAIRVSLDVDDKAGTIGKDLAALKQLALKGLLSEIKDDTARATMAKLVEGFDLGKATDIVTAFQSMLPKATPVGGVPVPSGAGNKSPGFFERGPSVDAAIQKSHRWE